MDPNHWNAYNLQYGHTTPSHTPLNRLELPAAGLGLSHTLQATHGSLGGRPMPALSTVNYSALGMPILDTMNPLATGIPTQPTHKTMALAQGQLVFDPQVRVTGEQQSPGLSRYDTSGSKSLSRDAVARNQLLEVAAARVWGNTNFSSTLYNQFGSLLPEVSAPVSISTSPGAAIARSTPQPQLHEPPPAHSSNVPRLSTIQRTPHTAEPFYARSTEAVIPSSLAHITSLYSSGSKPMGSSSAQQQNLHRQTPVQGFSSQTTIEDLSSSSQSQLYYANITDAQEFSAAHLAGDMNYEAVSPAAPLNSGDNHAAAVAAASIQAHGQPEHTAFSMVQFPDLANLTSEHAHTLADKFSENDFRLKMDSRSGQQSESLSSQLIGGRHELKIPKEMSSMQTSQNQRAHQFQPIGNEGLINLSQASSLNLSTPISLVSQAFTTSSMQQQAPIPVQAMADSTTKPKKSRSRKKKETSPAQSNTNSKKSTPTMPQVMTGSSQLSQSGHILNMPTTSPMTQLNQPSSIMAAASQQSYRSAANTQFSSSRDAQRAQTPSMPQNFSIQDQHANYTPSPKPNNSGNTMRNQGDFALPSRVTNEKPSYSKQRKSSGAAKTAESNNSNALYRSNIPEIQQVHNFRQAELMGNTAAQRGSPMQQQQQQQDAHGGRGMHSFSDQKFQSQISTLGQPSPQRNDFNTNTGKMNTNPNQILVQSPINSRPVSVEPTTMVHSYETGQQTTTLIDTQDSGQFQIDFVGQPFLEQLVAPITVAPSTYSHTREGENGEVIFTTLVNPAETMRLQQQPGQDTSSSDSFRPTYHGETVHEIRPVGHLSGTLGVEEVGFGSFFSNQGFPAMQQQQVEDQQLSVTESAEPEKMTLTFVPHVIEDDELSHFNNFAEPVVVIKSEPGVSSSKPSFQESFLNYLQGHKQETLSSVSTSAITKKPILPKYIPEPRRPRPPPPPPQLKQEVVTLSDEDGPSRVKDFLSSISDNDNSSQKSESDKEGYSVQRTSDLAVKIKLPKKKNKFGPFAEKTLLKESMRRNKELMKWKNRKKKGKMQDSDGEDYMPGDASEEEVVAQKEEVVRGPTPPPPRASIGRKAKDKCLERTKKRKHDLDSESSEEEVKKKPVAAVRGYMSDDSDKNYDSDKDPAWMPFDVDLKQGSEIDEKRRRQRRPKMRLPSVSKSVKTLSAKSGSSSQSSGAAQKSSALEQAGYFKDTPMQSMFKVGEFVIEKKDMHNYEGFPIWRVEPGNMICKFEARVVNGTLRHQAVGTYSTWMKSMENQFQVVHVKKLPMKSKAEPMQVEVLEESRPKPTTDKRLELQYENDPLVEPFSIYLQVFLSQALEPNFLKAIIETNEEFYVDALNQIDHVIGSKCQEIAKLAQWKASFLECLHNSPLMKEIDRPNLKQACQASENSSPPTIKSVVLSGHSYDKFLLTHTSSGNDAGQEFMIGKVAATYVRPYHSLYHFKYWLKQRCETKVKMMKDGGGNKGEPVSNEAVLDKCLENRGWVLQLFDNLKKLLKCGVDVPR